MHGTSLGAIRHFVEACRGSSHRVPPPAPPQVDDNATVYGVCQLVYEIVQRPPAVLAMSSGKSASGLAGASSDLSSRFLVTAPRCYCILTRVPSFELHFNLLNT